MVTLEKASTGINKELIRKGMEEVRGSDESATEPS